MDINGVCFINWLINVGEKIYLCIVEIYVYWLSFMDFGLINKDFNNILVLLIKFIVNVCEKKIDVGFDILFDFNDVFCFILNGNKMFLLFINDIE